MFKNPANDVWPIIGEEEKDICGICLDGMNYSKATVGPCLHSFHVHCIEEWRQVREQEGAEITCPLCRKIMMYYEI